MFLDTLVEQQQIQMKFQLHVVVKKRTIGNLCSFGALLYVVCRFSSNKLQIRFW